MSATDEQLACQDDLVEAVTAVSVAINAAITAGCHPDIILHTVATSIGLDISNIPPFFLAPMRNAMLTAMASRATA